MFLYQRRVLLPSDKAHDLYSLQTANVDTKYMISLLENYVNHLRKVDAQSQSAFSTGPLTYYMPADSVSPGEWDQFDNVYQVHCPNVYLDNVIRDVRIILWLSKVFDSLTFCHR